MLAPERQQSTNTSEIHSIAKPLVFISASSADYSWRDRLKTVARMPVDVLDWWDDSRIPPGSDWQYEIEAAIQSASVAVVLLSPAYLSSETARSELLRLSKETKSRELTLFPVVLVNCAWQEVEVLRQIQIWSGAKPISELPPDALDEELTRIAQSIFRLTSTDLQPPPEPNRPRFSFSNSAAAVLSEARTLAEQSRRDVVTSSCLLFAFAQNAGSRHDTAWFVREALSRNGSYESAFKTFLGDASSSSRAETVEGLPGKFSVNAVAAFEYAAAVASRVCGGSREIHARHLFAALLVTPATDGTPVARKRLARHGVDLVRLSVDFLQFLAIYVDSDNETEWRSILAPSAIPSSEPTADAPSPHLNLREKGASESQVPPTSANGRSPFVDGIPGYTSEFCGVGGTGPVLDHLGVENLAHRLAELMVLRETKLPLAVGLFGNWGSGKSHFMNLMDRHMKKLSSEKQKPMNAPDPDAIPQGPWCREIVPIYFNAWHYSDSNLWASLVTEVFDALFAHLQPKTDELALLQSRLRDAGGVTALAVEEARNASEGVRQADQALTKARADSEGARQVMRGLLDGLRSLVPELNTPQNRDRVAELLGVSPEAATLSELVAKRRELSSVVGRAKELWRRVAEPEGRAKRFAWLAGAIIAVGLCRLAAVYVPQIENLLTRIGPKIQTLLVALTAVTAWMIPIFKQVQSGLGQLEKWQKQAEDAQAAMPKDPEVMQAQENISRAEARARAAAASLAAAQSLEAHLNQAVKDLGPERRLSRFIEARARSADYRGQLGLVSLARRDFEELSSIFADAEALQQRIKETPQDAERLEKLSASVDRVVLFVDDLDRCEPEKVVDVLQAVHLLLAYPLFGVVVGVDQRCLKQSLRIRFKGLLTAAPQNGSDRSERPGDDDEIPATPLDYLEKIFHIPFHLPPMSACGFATLLETLTEPATVSVSSAPDAQKNKTTPLADSPGSDRPPLAVGDSQQPANIQFTNALSDTDDVQLNSAPVAAQAAQAPTRVLGSVPLNRWERDALKDYYSLIRTPRGATRLLNTYRLVRAGIPAPEWDLFRGDDGGQREFRVAMLLLAIAAGQPAVAREWFKLMRQRDSSGLPLPDEIPEAKRPEWENFRKLYDETSKQVGRPLTQELLIKWLDPVERFTF